LPEGRWNEVQSLNLEVWRLIGQKVGLFVPIQCLVSTIPLCFAIPGRNSDNETAGAFSLALANK